MSVPDSPHLQVNGQPRPMPQNLVILLQDCQIEPTQAGIAIAVNGEVVPRRQWETYPLHANDRVEIVHAVAGG